jgi:hypothetical protein
MQPSMDACAWPGIHQAKDRSWRPYVMRTPDAAMHTSLSHVYYPWQVFQGWRLQSPEGPLHQGSACVLSTLGRFSRDSDFDRRKGLYIKEVKPQDARSIKFSKTCRHRVPITLAPRQQFSWRRNGLGRSSKDLNRRSCPDYPARRGD